jgi:1A family penicillin-binding protein
VLLLSVGTAVALYAHFSQGLPDPGLIGQRRPAETTRIYARDGATVLFELVDPEGGQRTIVEFGRIPQLLKNATIAIEDANFYQNPGIDLRGVIRAVWLNYQNQAVVSGGSTITQQLVRGVLFSEEERTRVEVDRKLREMILAYQVGQRYSKDQILGLYLNQVYYGNQAYGVQAAAQLYFGKDVWDLSPAEQTLIAGLPQSPTTLDPTTNFEGAKRRQRAVLDQLVKLGYMSAREADTLFATPVNLTPPQTPLLAPHFVFYVRQQLEQVYGSDLLYRGGLRVVTSIDLNWQAEAERIVRERIVELRERNASNAGVIMLGPDNQILAMVGSVDYNDPAIDGQVNVTTALRQPGSALKPIVYAAALRRGWTPATVIWDEPVEYSQPGGDVYRPKNYDNAFHGPQRLRMALANSLNIPAVKAIEYVGVETFVEQANEMGITTFVDPTRFGLAMALGSNEVRLLDLANVYATLRNAGRQREPVAILSITNARGEILERFQPDPGRKALGEQGEALAYLLTDIMSDNQARQYMFGTNNVMELPDRLAAVKTGTSNDFRDSWAVGYTPDVVIGVWVGNSNAEPMQEIAGSNGAGVIWRDLMLSYHDGRPMRTFERPPGVEEALICADTGGRAGPGCRRSMAEVFLAGSVPSNSDVSEIAVRVGGDGSCLAATYTPASEIREVVFSVYPPEFREWARQRGVPEPPTEFCPPPKPVQSELGRITEPATGSVLSATRILISGVAQGGYILDYSAASSPNTWMTISQAGSSNGILGMWITDGLPAGEYTVRLRVTTVEGAQLEDRRTVRLQR